MAATFCCTIVGSSDIVSSVSETLPAIRHIMLVNTFVSVDDSLRNFLLDFQKELVSGQTEDPEFPFYFYKYISQKTQPSQVENSATKFFKENPISLRGRLALIQGVLDCSPLEKRVAKIYLPMYVIHSLTNCLVDVSHADSIEKIESVGYKGISQKEINLKRKIIYVEGGHNLFNDNPQRMLDLLHKFLLKR